MRRMILIGSVIALALGVIFFSTAKTSTQKTPLSNEQKSILVEVTQLPVEKNVIPVELQCPDAQLSASNTTVQLSCNITNNTSKNIISFVTAFSVTTERNGIKSEDIRMLISEPLIHPDLREIRKSSFIPPQGKSPIETLPTTYDDEIVRAAAHIDYVEFDDNSGIGPDQSGSRSIGEIRSGAIKYRNWLVEKYYQNGKSAEKIKELLKDDRILTETLNLKKNEYQGASVYRSYLNRMYETNGVEGLERNLIKMK